MQISKTFLYLTLRMPRDVLPLLLTEYILLFCSFGLVKSYNMPCAVESASLEPNCGNKFVTGGEDMWVRVFDFFTGEELGKSLCFKVLSIVLCHDTCNVSEYSCCTPPPPPPESFPVFSNTRLTPVRCYGF
jgi:hypothetical protein